MNTPASMSFDDFVIRAQRGVFFSVVFVKRTTNEERHMLCRKGVKKYLAGGTLKYNPAEKNLLMVFDIRISQYRSINLEGLLTLKIGGVIYDWNFQTKTFNLQKVTSSMEILFNNI